MIASQVAFEPALRLEVEIIGRLIQQQDIGIQEKEPRQFNACLPAATELG